jgi:hypothetical protein
MYRFCYTARNLERIDFYLDSGKVDKQYRAAFENTVNLTYIKGINTSATYDVRDLFSNSGIETIEMPLNFSNVKQSDKAFRCDKLKDISFYLETIPVSLTFTSKELTVDSAKSIILGLKNYSEDSDNQFVHTLKLPDEVWAKLAKEEKIFIPETMMSYTWHEYVLMVKMWNT